MSRHDTHASAATAAAPPVGAKLAARGLGIEYRNPRTRTRTVAVSAVDLSIREGEFVSIVGPSGCGKSTFLNAVAGILTNYTGELFVDGRPVRGPGRDRAMVFQQAALLPWRTTRRNVAYGLELRHTPSVEVDERVARVLRLVGLRGFEDHYPSELSGGMQQRANLARALALEPDILLLDEPFAALDAQTREYMQQELVKIWQRTRNTSLFVTHQISEAIFLADRVLVFSARPGRILEEIPIELERPRELRIKRSGAFLEYEERIWTLIEEQAGLQGLIPDDTDDTETE